jgi:hypothetical protein
MTPTEKAEVESLIRAAKRAIETTIQRPMGTVPDEVEDFLAEASGWEERHAEPEPDEPGW